MMNTGLTPELKEVVGALHYRPAISIIMPFSAKINLETELKHAFKIALDKVELELSKNFSEEVCQLMMDKLKTIIDAIIIEPHQKGVAIFVSPVFQKVMFMDTMVQERIVIDDSFEIRDLIYSKQQSDKYLVLLLSGNQFSMYLGSTSGLTKIKSNIPDSIDAYTNEWPEKVANFTDGNDRKQIVLQKYLQHIDQELTRVVSEYKLPVFVLGAEKVLGFFRKTSKNEDRVVGYISGNYEHLSLPKLEELLKSHLDSSRLEKEKALLKILDDAMGKTKLVTGVKPVWEAVMNNLGNRLYVEKDFVFSAQRGSNEYVIDDLTAPYNEFSYIRDAVDDLIEKVILNGGQVEFTAPNALKELDHIALVTY